MPAELGRLALQCVAIIADPLHHLAHLVGRHAVAARKRLHFVLFLAGHPGTILSTHKCLVVGHSGLLAFRLMGAERQRTRLVPSPSAPLMRAAGHKLPVDLVEPEDIARAILFLLSDAGRYITGAALPVDAGGVLK